MQISQLDMASLITSEKAYSEAIAASHLAVLHFLADWAPECSTVTAVLTELSKDPGLSKVKFFQLEAEKMPEISMKHEIVAVPTVLMFRNSKAVDRIDGVNAADLTKKVKLHANDPVANLPLAPTAAKPVEDLETKLKRLINARKCMLFMKGNPEEPKCGFSKQTVAIMKELNASYGTFDILSDDEVS